MRWWGGYPELSRMIYVTLHFKRHGNSICHVSLFRTAGLRRCYDPGIGAQPIKL
jgi:hypothetical protein